MLILIPIAAWILSFLGWDNFRLPVEFDRLLGGALIFCAVTCAVPLRKIFLRAQPLGLFAKFFVFMLILLFWTSAFAPLAIIFNVRFDQSSPEKIEQKVLETKDRGPGVCVVKVAEWMPGKDEQWLWLDCKEPLKVGDTAQYYLRKGALRFAWISSNTSGM